MKEALKKKAARVKELEDAEKQGHHSFLEQMVVLCRFLLASTIAGRCIVRPHAGG